MASSGPIVKQMKASLDHSCVLFHNGQVKCWGGNADGQLGVGDAANRGDGLGEMGAALPPVSLGTDSAFALL